MPRAEAVSYRHEREGLEVPVSRWGAEHVPAEVIIGEDTELEPSHDVTPRQVGGPALTGAELFTAA